MSIVEHGIGDGLPDLIEQRQQLRILPREGFEIVVEVEICAVAVNKETASKSVTKIFFIS